MRQDSPELLERKGRFRRQAGAERHHQEEYREIDDERAELFEQTHFRLFNFFRFDFSLALTTEHEIFYFNNVWISLSGHFGSILSVNSVFSFL